MASGREIVKFSVSVDKRNLSGTQQPTRALPWTVSVGAGRVSGPVRRGSFQSSAARAANSVKPIFSLARATHSLAISASFSGILGSAHCMASRRSRAASSRQNSASLLHRAAPLAKRVASTYQEDPKKFRSVAQDQAYRPLDQSSGPAQDSQASEARPLGSPRAAFFIGGVARRSHTMSESPC